MQYVIIVGSHGRIIAKLDEAGNSTGSMRICSEANINNMSDGSFDLYRKKVFAWATLIHEHGTPEAIRTIDFLRAACGRSRTTRARADGPPVC